MLGRFSAVAGCVAAFAGGATIGSFEQAEATKLVFLDVGQGDCAVIASGTHTFMVDAGPRTERFDAGSRIVAPKLRQLGIDRVDLLFISHPDLDHIGGLPGLASRIRIDKMAVPAHFRGHALLSQCLAEARISESDVLWLDRPLSGKSEQLRFTIRLPDYSKSESENKGSLFLRFAVGESSVLFTGDADEEVETIEASRFDWQADLLKAGHHGSATSTSATWLDEVMPRTVVVSCGPRNRYGHPAEPTLDRIQSFGSKIFRTDLDGDLIFIPTRSGFAHAK